MLYELLEDGAVGENKRNVEKDKENWKFWLVGAEILTLNHVTLDSSSG